MESEDYKLFSTCGELSDQSELEVYYTKHKALVGLKKALKICYKHVFL